MTKGIAVAISQKTLINSRKRKPCRRNTIASSARSSRTDNPQNPITAMPAIPRPSPDGAFSRFSLTALSLAACFLAAFSLAASSLAACFLAALSLAACLRRFFLAPFDSSGASADNSPGSSPSSVTSSAAGKSPSGAASSKAPASPRSPKGPCDFRSSRPSNGSPAPGRLSFFEFRLLPSAFDTAESPEMRQGNEGTDTLPNTHFPRTTKAARQPLRRPATPLL